MQTPGVFTRDQLAKLGEAVRAGRPPSCPACGAKLDQRSVPPREDVSYVRDRVWLVCPSCHRSTVLDRREP